MDGIRRGECYKISALPYLSEALYIRGECRFAPVRSSRMTSHPLRNGCPDPSLCMSPSQTRAATSIGSLKMPTKTARRNLSLTFGLAVFFSTVAVRSSRADDEAIIFTAPGFHKPGQAMLKPPVNSGRLKVTVRDARTGEPTFCRVNVIGADGNFYYPKQNYLTPYALTG